MAWLACRRDGGSADRRGCEAVSMGRRPAVEYRPPGEREPDSQYRLLLDRIVSGGVSVPTRQGPAALTLMQQAMRFDLANGFPMITERSLRSFWRKSIGELCAFINGATTLAELAEFGCDWWGPWATPEKTGSRGLAPGSLGPGSYGGAFRDFPTAEGGGFDQFRHLVEQLNELPGDRTHFVSPWIPQYQVRGRGLGHAGARAAAAAHGPAHRGRPEGHRHPRIPRRALRGQRLRAAPGDLVHPGLPVIVSLVVAASTNEVIGADGALPWHLPGDLRRVRDLTTGHVVVMGRLTYPSILDRPGHPLTGRTSVV